MIATVEIMAEEILLLKSAQGQILSPRDINHSGPQPKAVNAAPQRLEDVDERPLIALLSNRPATETLVVGTEPPKQPKHNVKLESFAGNGASIEAFLAKFEEHSRYFQWGEDDRVFQLKNSLTGTAATVLWVGGANATTSELIALLKDQHGTENQLERFWLELYARCHKPNESLQELYQDIRRLISLACPNDKSDTSERLAINQFTSTLDNEDIRFQVLNQNPSKLETALHIAMRYEALKPEHSVPQGTPTALWYLVILFLSLHS